MPKVRQDAEGIYMEVGGYIARPVLESRYNIGNIVDHARHKAGGIRCGIGKDENCKAGEYLETWVITGDAYDYKKDPAKYWKSFEEHYRYRMGEEKALLALNMGHLDGRKSLSGNM